MRELTADTVPVGPCKVRALYSWSGEDKRDLGFVEGDIIQVLNTGDGNWWTGRLKRNRVVGLFPRNFVEYVDPEQPVARVARPEPTPSVADLGINDPLTSSTGSQQSTKSAEEILKDVGAELNRGFLDDISLDARPSELFVGGPTEGTQASSPDDLALTESAAVEDSFTVSEDDGEPPAPPPHRVWPVASEEDALMQPVTASPDLDEIPFDPKAFNPAAQAEVQALEPATPSHLNSPAGKSASTPGSASPTRTPGTPGIARAGPGAATTPNASLSHPMTSPSPSPSKKGTFLQKLLPKNSRLRRVPSSSAKSVRSTRSSASQRLRSIKSLFSFPKSIMPDSDLYPTNELSRSDPSPSRHAKVSSGGPSTASPNGNLVRQGSGKWIAHRRDLYRAKTLIPREREQRLRAMELQGISSANPMLALDTLEFHDYRLESHDSVDEAITSMSTWPQLMTPAVLASSRIGRRWTDPVERLRAVFLLCATRIDVDLSGAGSDKDNTDVNVVQTRRATPLQLARCVVAMAEALGIEALVVEGHLRQPDGDRTAAGGASSGPRPHAWTAMRIHGEWRLLDAASASPSFHDQDEVNGFYFLTPPNQLIYMHLPTDPSHQFLMEALGQPLTTAEAATLPVASPAAFAHGVTFAEYAAGLTRLSGLETCELELRVPDPSTDIVALVNGSDKAALAQPFWNREGERRARIKAFVPAGESEALLQLYAVDKSQLRRTPDEMELVWTVSLRHTEEGGSGNVNSPFEFVARYGAPSTHLWDLYISEPQCRQLGGGETYVFKFEHHPTNSTVKTQPRMAVQSPSGRLTRLVPRGTDPHDTAKVTVKTLEVGTWRAVVSAPGSDDWVPFGEWFCS